jgi:hypothetical protein
MKWIAIAGLVWLQEGCSGRAVRCDAHLRPINTVAAVPELPVSGAERAR